jgi:hypothetical protein
MKGTAMYETRRALVVGLAVALTLVTTAAPAASSPAAQAPESQADAQFSDYHFRDGQTLADLRLHYATLGTPHRDANLRHPCPASPGTRSQCEPAANRLSAIEH